jgi:Protein of unknown function (DUF1583)
MLTSSVVAFVALAAANPPAQNYYDFRGGNPLPPELTLVGPNAGQVVKLEAEGLHVTLPTDGQQTSGWGVGLRYTLAGDFEVTGTYELISVAPPARGAGAGVAINALPTPDWKKFAKIGRFVRADEGNIYVAETWHTGYPKDYHRKAAPTAARSGMVRLARHGSVLHYLAADAPGGEFQEIGAWEFGPEDLSMVRFIVNNNGSPTPVEARLLDLRVTADVKPLAAEPVEIAGEKSKPGFPLAWVLGLIAAALLIATGVRLVVRRRGAAGQGVEARAEER